MVGYDRGSHIGAWLTILGEGTNRALVLKEVLSLERTLSTLPLKGVLKGALEALMGTCSWDLD